MEPRLKTSKKKTEFPIDYIKLIKEVVSKNFKKPLKENRLIVEGYIFAAEILIRIGFQDKKTIAQRNFEASVEYSAKAKDIMAQIYLAIDALGAMIDQFYKSEDEDDLPSQWLEFKLDGKSVYLKSTRENSDLEAQANALLKEHGGLPDDEDDDIDD